MPKVTVKCANPNCRGKGFVEVYPYRLKTTKNFFCCPECQSEFNSKPKKPQIAVKCALEGCDKVKYVTETEFKSKKNFFCCKKHHDEFKKKQVTLICDYCGDEYSVSYSRSIRKQEHNFCKVECHNEFMKNRITAICDYCGDEYETIPSKYNPNGRNFCCEEHRLLGIKTNRYEIFDDYAELIITSKTHGEIRVKIDKEDVEKCKQLTWIANHYKRYNSWYIQNNTWIDGVCKTTLLHRYIMDCPPDKEVDHQLHDWKDCRKKFLKIVTRQENLENLRLSPKNKSGYRGVCFRKDMNKWQAYYSRDNHKVHVGFFDTAELANEAVVKARNEVMTNNVLDRINKENNND